MELWRYYRIIRRRRWLVLTCMAACIGIVMFYCLAMTPTTYIGETRVMERQPTEMGVPVYGEQAIIQANIEMHLSDLAHIAASNTVVERSTETLGQLGVSLDPKKLMATLKIEPVPDTQILSIKVSSTKPDEAKAAADVVSAEFRRFYRELVTGATEQSREFIEKQLRDAEAKLAKAREARKQFEEQNEVVELTSQTRVLIDRTAQIENEKIHADVETENLQQRLNIVDSEVNGKPEYRKSAQTLTDNPIYQQLLTQKIAAETELGSKLGSGTEPGAGRLHPEVTEIQRRIAKIDKQIETTAQKIVSNEVTSLDQIVVNALQDKLNTAANIAGNRARAAALAQALARQTETMSSLPGKEMKMAKLNLDISAAEQTYALLRAKLDEARIKVNETSKSSAVQEITPAYVYLADSRKALKFALAFLLSPLLGIGLAFLLNYMDNTVKTSAEAEDLLGLPVVSVIPLGRSHALARRPDNEPLLASYGMLTAMLWRNLANLNSRVLLVASGEPETGRSVTAANMAIALARDGARVILVDADMRKPNLHQMFGVAAKPGLSNVLTGTLPIEEALVPTKIEGLLLMPAGPAPDNPIRLLRSTEMEEFVGSVGKLADFVIFDSPAGVTFADAAMLASWIKNVLVIHAAGRVPRGAEAEFRHRLDLAGANVIGAVLNKVKPEDCHGYFHYRRFYEDLTAQSALRASSLTGVRAIPPSDSDE